MVGSSDHSLFALLDYLPVCTGADLKSRDGSVRGRDRFKLDFITAATGAFRRFTKITKNFS